MSSHKRYDPYKRLLDVSVAVAGLVLLSPVMLVTAILVAHKHGRPVIFAQDRPGREGRIFKLYKFRSMRDVDRSRGLITDEDRITSFGSKLRSTSLDELPSLVNVLKGEMSIVGPRPLLVKYLDLYTPQQARRHEVRPGVTGLAQVSGRNGLEWSRKFALDTVYVRKRSLLLDLVIIMRTIKSVVGRDGISEEGHVSTREFSGSSHARRDP